MTRQSVLSQLTIATLLVGAGLRPAPGQSANAGKKVGESRAGGIVAKSGNELSSESDGTTALHRAIYREDLETTKRLVQGGADVNATTRYGVTPLSLACTTGNARIIDTLLEAGADPGIASGGGETPLMLAARAGNAGAVRTLIDYGANVNSKETWKGQTALMWAAAEGHVSVIHALIDAGADIHARSSGTLTAFLFAVREGRMAAVKALLTRGANVNETFVSGPRRGAPAPGIPPAAPAGGGPSALALAVGNAHFELAALLLDAGADPNAAAQGWTALHELTWVRKPGEGSNNPAPTGSGSMSSLELVRKLVEQGADVNARITRAPAGATMTHLNRIGGTPFFMAARTGDVELMRLLVELGADPLLPNQEETTPLMAAAGLGTRSPGEDAGTEPEAFEAVKLCLDLGNDVNAVDIRGNTAMHGAAMKELPSVVRLLTERGAKVDVWNHKNAVGWTPLRIAVGVFRSDNFRFSVPTAEALREVMTAAGVSTELEASSTITGAAQPN